MKKKLSLAVMALFTAQHAAAQDFAIGAGASTTGVNANAQLSVGRFLAIRGGYHYLDYTMEDEEYDGISYDADLDFSNVEIGLDAHPFANGFVIGAGAMIGDKEVLLTAVSTDDVEIGGLIFTETEYGALNGAATLKDAAPYLVIGWDSALYTDRKVSFHIRGGVMFTGSPEVTLDSAGGTLSDDPTLQAALANEVVALEQDIEDYEYYPVLNAGLNFRF